MAAEEGIVTRVDGVMAEVKTIKSEACAGCSAKGFCHDAGREMTVSVRNSANARPGDRVRLEIATGAYIKAMLLLYIVPVACLLAGAAIGLPLGGEDAAALCALAGLALSVVVVRVKGRRMGTMSAYQPRIVRILERGVQVGEPCAPPPLDSPDGRV